MLQKIRHTLEMIKFSHSIFALPFAVAALFLAANGLPPLKTLGLVLLCMVFARNTAMAFNRLIDADIDAQNPRTATRHIPQGLISRKFVAGFAVVNAALFIGTTVFLNTLSFILSPVALAILLLYSTTKRWTHFTQIFLGLSLGVAPIGAWIALTGRLDWPPVLLGAGVLFWVAGFDLLYATQDYEFDRKAKLKSLVVKWGIPKSLWAARLFHLATVLLFALLGWITGLNFIYGITLLAIALFLIYEHSLVKANDLSQINMAFFTVNGFVGMIFLAGVILETTLKS